MRILIIRHGDPYYPTDSLTEKGQREAELLGERLAKENITAVYVSPLGRAKKTAQPLLDRQQIPVTVLDWLREFPVQLREEFAYDSDLAKHNRCIWNHPPRLWTEIPGIYDADGWRNTDRFGAPEIVQRYETVRAGWDALLASHGYTREGNIYRIAEGWEEKHETIALFCHLGLGNTLISQILNLSPVAVWHTIFLPTTSVTTVFMEQHIKDEHIAHARLVSIGDTSHLYAGGEPVSASGLHTDFIQ